MEIIKFKKGLPRELNLYIIQFIPIQKCIICKRNFYGFQHKFLCSDKCKTIYKLQIIQIKLYFSFVRTHNKCLELSRIIFIATVCFLYVLAKLIAFMTLLLVHNFDLFIVNYYFIEE
jgi:hypothetical protein